MQELATTLAEKSPIALRTMKHLVNSGMQTDLEHGLEFELQNAFMGDLIHRFGSRALQERYLPGMASACWE